MLLVAAERKYVQEVKLNQQLIRNNKLVINVTVVVVVRIWSQRSVRFNIGAPLTQSRRHQNVPRLPNILLSIQTGQANKVRLDNMRIYSPHTALSFIWFMHAGRTKFIFKILQHQCTHIASHTHFRTQLRKWPAHNLKTHGNTHDSHRHSSPDVSSTISRHRERESEWSEAVFKHVCNVSAAFESCILYVSCLCEERHAAPWQWYIQRTAVWIFNHTPQL